MNKYPVSLTAGTERRRLSSPTELLIDQNFIMQLAAAVKTAKDRIWVCAYTWRWYENAPAKDIQHFNAQIVRAARRGVDVRAIMHNRAQAAFLNSVGVKSHRLQTNKTMHTKAILIDDRVLFLGSHNLTEKGTAENFECSVMTYELEPILQYETYFKRMWENFSAKTA